MWLLPFSHFKLKNKLSNKDYFDLGIRLVKKKNIKQTKQKPERCFSALHGIILC